MPRSILVVLCLAVGACSSPASPSAEPLTGTWVGTAIASPGGSGAVRLTLVQKATDVSGTLTVAFPTLESNDSGTVTGTLSGSAVSLTFRSSAPNRCPAALSGTLSGNTISGTYAAFSCDQPASGSFTVTRQ